MLLFWDIDSKLFIKKEDLERIFEPLHFAAQEIHVENLR